MRILLVHSYYQQPGGEDVVVANERHLLEQSGHATELHAAHNAAISGFAGKLDAFLHVTYNAKAREAMARELARFRPDIVHVHNTFPLLSPSIYDACADAAVPVVQTLHNYRMICAAADLFRAGKPCDLCKDGHPYRAVWHRCYRGSLLGSAATAHMIAHHRQRATWSRKVARFIALSPFARAKFIEGGLPPDRIVVKPNFTEDPGPRGPSRRHGALFVGRLRGEKGGAELMEAWTRIDYPLRILGDGPERQRLTALAPSNVTFEGRVGAERVRTAMREASFLVLPSLVYENFPLAVAEAFATGLPVVAYRHGAFADIIEDRVTGRLVEPRNLAALAGAVTELATHPDLVHAMSLAARERYERLYTPERNLELLLAIYSQARNEPLAPALSLVPQECERHR
jgi:glycosyltransferase involved in cell wall biosynthesis